ncbi:MAG: type III-A CRISPR-associated RAMP protein Csm5 [Candidatus Lokiarchaeota archaeon]|nr:type III-A CRISPR-associated RAMP protein Csm5 [Candidatus Lokiarchaeota archaeon]
MRWNRMNSEKVSITGLSPIFIGSGDAYSQLDYIKDEHTVFILDRDSLWQDVPVEMIEDFTNQINTHFHNNIWKGDLRQFFGDYGLDWKNYIKKKLKLDSPIGKNEINQFIKTADTPYIPGSSIKGSLKTAVYYYCLLNNERLRDQLIDSLNRTRKKKDVYSTLESYLRRHDQPNPKNDLFRGLMISDARLSHESESLSVKKSVIYHLYDLKFHSPVYHEVLEKDFQALCSIKIDDKLINSTFINEIRTTFDLNKENLIDAANEFTKRIIDFEIECFEYCDDSNLEGVLTFYKGLKNVSENLSSNECLLRLGQGSSFIGTTMFLIYWDDPQILLDFTRLIRVRFSEPDRKNPNSAIARTERGLIIPHRNSPSFPMLNEEWLCKVKSKKRNSRFVDLKYHVDADFRYTDIIYPETRKFVVVQEKNSAPFGWIKLKWDE